MADLRVFRSAESDYWHVAHLSTYPDTPAGSYQLTSMLPIEGTETPVGHNVWRDLHQATLAATGHQAISACGILDLPVGDRTYKEDRSESCQSMNQ